MSQVSMPESDAPATPGTRVAHYDILAVIGQGGNAIVYRALDTQLGREVALKSLRPSQARNDESLRRFLREPRAASRLNHPNVVAIHEVFEEAGFPWIAMQLVDGRSLRTLLGDGRPLPIDQVLRYAEELALALQAAHDRHVVHRDVNPNNVLIDRSGRALLGDFGIAGFFTPEGAPDGTHSQSSELSGAFVGTFPYMSPEQLLGRPLDGRSDLFSLGAVLYEMCSGRLAFPSREPARLLDDILHHEPEPLRHFTYDCPPELESIIRKALRKDPEERYQNAREIVADIRALRHRLQSPPASTARTRRFGRGLILGLTILLAMTGAGWFLQGWRMAHRPLPRVRPVPVTTGDGTEWDPALSPDGNEIAFVSEQSGNPEIWIVDAAGGPAQPVTDSPGLDESPAWFPDGRTIAFVSDRGGSQSIWRVARRGGLPTLLLANAWDPAISPDGRMIAFARAVGPGQTRIGVASVVDTSDARLLTDAEDGLWVQQKPAWSPDGRTLCYQDQENLWVVPSGGGAARRLTADATGESEPAFTPDGRFLYVGSMREYTQAVWRWPLAGGRPLRLTLGAAEEQQPSMGRNPRRLCYATHESREVLVLIDRRSGQSTELSGGGSDLFPALQPDGRAVYFASTRWGRQDLWRQEIREGRFTGDARRITDQTGRAAYPAVSPDGRWIAYYRILGGQRDLWTIPTDGGNAVRFTDDPAPDYHPAWSPDGQWLAWIAERSGAGRGHVMVQAARDGRPDGPARDLTPGAAAAVTPVWSPDGREIDFIESGEDLWRVAVDGRTPPEAVTRGARLIRAACDPTGPYLLASHREPDRRARLVRIDPATGAMSPADVDVVFGRGPVYPDFSLSHDGRYLIFVRNEQRGDIWLLDATSGAF